MLQELEVSLPTFKRDLEYMRDRLNSPIEWDREERGYRYAKRNAAWQQPLPGLRFNASEAYALLMMQALLGEMQPGLLGTHIEPLKARLRAVIESGRHPIVDVEPKVQLLTVAARSVPEKFLEIVAGAMLRGERVRIRYFSRVRNESGAREVPPQRLLRYTGNWYLIAWCHMQDGMRSFAVGAIEDATEIPGKVKTLPKREMNSFIDQGYGIFSGSKVRWDTLRISADRARWVEREMWYPAQKLEHGADGSLLMKLPFTYPRELIMEILRHSSHVEVLGPPELKRAVVNNLMRALGIYSDDLETA